MRHEKQVQREMLMIPSISVHPQHVPETELAMEVFHFPRSTQNSALTPSLHLEFSDKVCACNLPSFGKLLMPFNVKYI